MGKIALTLGLSLDGLGHLVLPGPNSALASQDGTVGMRQRPPNIRMAPWGTHKTGCAVTT